MKKRYALLDDNNQVIRWFDYQAKGTVEIKEQKLTFDELLEKVGECLI